MRKSIISITALLMLSIAGIRADEQAMTKWAAMKGSVKQPDGSIKVVMNRDRKTFYDGGVTQKILKPTPGWYEVGIQVQGNGLTELSQWIQLKKTDGKFVYRAKVHPLKKQIPEWESYKFVFEIPEGIDSAYLLCALRTSVDNKNGTALVREIYLKPAAKPAETGKTAAAPAAQPIFTSLPAAKVDSYLKQITADIPKSHPRLFYSEALLAEMKRKAAAKELQPTMQKLKTTTEAQYKRC